MKNLALSALCLAVAAHAAPSARAGDPIDATAYLPVGAFDAWEMIDKALWNLGAEPTLKDEGQIIDIGKVFVVGGAPRYNVRTPFFEGVDDIVLQFGIEDGVLSLHAVRVVDGDSLIGDDDLSVPTMFFDDPVPVGDTATALDTDFAVTPVTAKIEVSIDVGPEEIDGTVFVTGTITARWNSVLAPIATPLGVLGDDETLAELELTADLTYSSPDPDIHDELADVQTHKTVRGVLGPGIGFVQIDGKGSQQKIVNRAILPGQLVSNPLEPDAFPALPPGDLLSFALDVPPVVTLHGTQGPIEEGGLTDGTVTLDDIELDHALGGKLVLTAQVSAAGSGPVDLVLLGTAKPNPKTGGLKVKLAGKTKKLTTFAKSVKFSVNQELAAPLGGPAQLDILYNAGKDPLTLELIEGALPLPLTPFVGDTVSVTVNLPVDVPKYKKGFFSINPAKRALGAEGVLVLGAAGNGDGKTFPVILRETATVKDGLPTVRPGKLLQTGTTLKVFSLSASSTSALDYALTKLSGKLLGVKVLPLIEDVTVAGQ